MSSVKGPLSADSPYLASCWQGIERNGEEPGFRAARYLQIIRDLAVNPYWIGLSDQGVDCSQALKWIGHHVGEINHQLEAILQECLTCFHPDQRPETQIFAAPILSKAGIDGFCNLNVTPVTLIVDPGRVMCPDWYKLVIHEVAHGMANSAGHGEAFRNALAHLCLAFDLPEPPADAPRLLQTWPPYLANTAPALFWHLDHL